MRAIDFPHEANAVLVIDANTVLPGPISLQRLQSVSGRSAQIIQIHGGLELVQLPPGNRLNACPSSAGTGFKDLLRISVLEALNHPEQRYNVSRSM
jgi:hypothetical protein